MRMFLTDMGIALSASFAYAGAVVFPAVLCLFVAACMVAMLIAHKDRIDGLDRFIFCGVAVSAIAIIPALIPPHLWGAGWSIGLFLLFLSALFGRRFLIPALMALRHRSIG